MRCLLIEEDRQKMALEYIAQHTWYVARAVYGIAGQELSTPSYLELAYPDAAKKDNRTAEEIIQDTIDKL